MLFLILYSCTSETKKETIPQAKEIISTSEDCSPPQQISQVNTPVKSVQLTSKLKEKVTRLATLEHKYQLKSLEEVTQRESMVLGGFLRVLPLRDANVKEIDTIAFKKYVHTIHKAFLKGKKPMRPNGNTYPRVTVEEYIFKTPENATAILNMLKKSESDAGLWMPISKAPYELFLEENRIYFMSSGGFYMMEIYKDIFEKIKN